jgi:hypothetical protein
VSVIISDLVYFGAADMPESDGATTGGAINFNTQVEMTGTAISPATQIDVVSSSSSDTAVKAQVFYRDATGLAQTPAAVTLNGTTKVSMTTTAAERFLAGVVTGGAVAGLSNPGGTAAVGDVAMIAHTLTISAHTMAAASTAASTSAPATVTLQSGDGASVTIGMILHTTGGTGPNQLRRIIAINPLGTNSDQVAIDRNLATALDTTTTYEVGVGFYFPVVCSSQGVNLTDASHLTQCTAITRLFATAAAQAVGGSNETFYEKIFVNNNNLTTALGATGNAQVILQAIGTALPSGVTLEIALANSRNDTSTITTRNTPGTPPSGVTSYQGVGTGITVPSGPGTLPASASAGSATSAQAIWLQLGANAGSPAWESSVTIRTTGTSA